MNICLRGGAVAFTVRNCSRPASRNILIRNVHTCLNRSWPPALSISYDHAKKLYYSTRHSEAEKSHDEKLDVKSPVKNSNDPRIKEVERQIQDEYAALRDAYETPKNPIILAHGLLGFDELHLAGQNLPGIHYWRGITEALRAKGVEVITCSVPPSGSIEARAARLAEDIANKAHGKSVNIVAGMSHLNMSQFFTQLTRLRGLDSRYMISQLKPPNVKVLSLTTVASPHRGSAFADYVLNLIGPVQIPKLYKTLEFFGLDSAAFAQLTQKYMQHDFNPKTPDLEGVRYYSYGASFTPYWYSVFRQSYYVIEKEEGANDGMVSVTSSKWGTYKGTLIGVSHLDLINWTNRLRWWFFKVTGNKQNFNAIAFYLDIADMLAKEGL